MPQIVKNNAVLQAERLDETIEAPGPHGEEIAIAAPGMWVLYQETEEGYAFKGFITDLEYREKHRLLLG